MKKSAVLFATIILAATAMPVLAQADLAFWGFEVNTPPDSTAALSGPGAAWAADSGKNAATSFSRGVHTSATTAWSTPSGNGSFNSFSSSAWATAGATTGNYYQFDSSSTGNFAEGFSGIKVSWDHTSSNTGPRDFKLQYSTNGINYTDAIGGAYSVLANAAPNPTWNTATSSALYNTLVSLKDITALDNAPLISFRLVQNSLISANGGAVAAAGTSRVDNFLIRANIPEPVTLTLLGLGGLLVGRRRRG